MNINVDLKKKKKKKTIEDKATLQVVAAQMSHTCLRRPSAYASASSTRIDCIARTCAQADTGLNIHISL